ncbi:unnamed protein product, partial [Symbiodinium pilosum]
HMTEDAHRAWNSWPDVGPRFEAIAAALQMMPPPQPSQLARTLHQLLECAACDGGPGPHQADLAFASGLEALPAAPLSLPDAVLLCMAPDGWLPYSDSTISFGSRSMAELGFDRPLGRNATPRPNIAARSALHARGSARSTGAGKDPRSQGRAELLSRAAKFQRGEWPQLLRSARQAAQQPTSRNEPQQDGAGERKRRRVCAKVRQAEVSRARQVLTAAEIAPGTQATLRALTDPARRPPELRREIPEEVLQHQPQQPTRLATGAVASALRETHRGGAAGLSGMRTEHLKLLLQDVEAMELLAEAASQLASAEVSPDIARGISAARLTALSKPDGGVRGIATGDGLRRLVSRTLAKGWAAIFDQAT